jgi:hypothetical protein
VISLKHAVNVQLPNPAGGEMLGIEGTDSRRGMPPDSSVLRAMAHGVRTLTGGASVQPTLDSRTRILNVLGGTRTSERGNLLQSLTQELSQCEDLELWQVTWYCGRLVERSGLDSPPEPHALEKDAWDLRIAFHVNIKIMLDSLALEALRQVLEFLPKLRMGKLSTRLFVSRRELLDCWMPMYALSVLSRREAVHKFGLGGFLAALDDWLPFPNRGGWTLLDGVQKHLNCDANLKAARWAWSDSGEESDAGFESPSAEDVEHQPPQKRSRLTALDTESLEGGADVLDELGHSVTCSSPSTHRPVSLPAPVPPWHCESSA